jgi:hypothetical protein
VVILESNSKPVKRVEPQTRVIVAVERERYKASDDFVFFGRDKNDNNNERSVPSGVAIVLLRPGQPERPA